MMRNYRIAFALAMVGNLALVVVLAGLWWSTRRSAARQSPATSPSTAAFKSGQSNSPVSTPPPVETPLAPIQLSAQRLQSIGVKFGQVERKSIQDEIRTTGTVAIDETRLAYVQTRFPGHIEEVFANASYQFVRKGQPLFMIHSPEIVLAEREYLLAKENAKALSQSTVPGVAAGVASLLNSSKERLAQWNMSQEEIARLESTGQIAEHLQIDSPVSGYITERNALPNLNVQMDTRLYTIADLSTVWVLAQVFQNDLGHIRVGAPATFTVDSYPDRLFRGKVDFIYPDVDMTTRTARVRLVFSNPNLTLTPGMYVNVVFKVSLGNQIVIPASGALQSGMRQIVFVDRGGGYLEPRSVQLGPQAGDQYVVLKGLNVGERIVTSANFLIDSESQLQAAIGSLALPPTGEGTPTTTPPAGQTTPQVEFSTEPSSPHKGTNLYRVKLLGPDGVPVTNAQVSLRSYMPGMPQMGMAAISVVTPLGEKGSGIYEGQVTLDSGGTWQITITAVKNGTVLVTKQLSLNAEGGM